MVIRFRSFFGIIAICFLVSVSCLSTANGQDSVQFFRFEKAGFEPSVAINRKDPNQLLIVASPGVLFNSTDAGKSWKASSMPDRKESARNFLVQPSRKGDFYCFSVYSSPSGDGIDAEVSEDNGATWRYVGGWEPQGKNIAGPRVNMNQKTAELMMTWTEFDQLGSKDEQNQSSIRYALTKDGKKWSDSRTLNQFNGDCLDGDNTPRGATPSSTVDGKVFVTWSYNGKIYLDRTFDKGSFWLSNDIPIIDQAGGWQFEIPGMTRAHGLPAFFVDGSPTQYNGSLCMLYGAQRPTGETDIYFTRSYNLGDNWTSVNRVSDEVNASYKFMPALTVDNVTGIIYGAYYSRASADENLTDVYLIYSVDNGTSFKHKKISSASFAVTDQVGECISIDAYRGIISVTWTAVDGDKPFVEVATLKQESIIQLPNQSKGKKK